MVGLEHPTIRLRGGDVTTSSPLHVTIVILQSNRMDFIEIKNSMIITHIKRLVQRRICGGGGGGRVSHAPPPQGVDTLPSQRVPFGTFKKSIFSGGLFGANIYFEGESAPKKRYFL